MKAMQKENKQKSKDTHLQKVSELHIYHNLNVNV